MDGFTGGIIFGAIFATLSIFAWLQKYGDVPLSFFFLMFGLLIIVVAFTAFDLHKASLQRVA